MEKWINDCRSGHTFGGFWGEQCQTYSVFGSCNGWPSTGSLDEIAGAISSNGECGWYDPFSSLVITRSLHFTHHVIVKRTGVLMDFFSTHWCAVHWQHSYRSCCLPVVADNGNLPLSITFTLIFREFSRCFYWKRLTVSIYICQKKEKQRYISLSVQ